MLRIVRALLFLSLVPALQAQAQQSQSFDGYTVHYNAINTSQLSPQVAQTYGLQRSSSRALLNIAVLKEQGGQEPVAARAVVTAGARNLSGQLKEIDMREINEANEAIYYIGEFRVNNMEMFDFTVQVTPEGSTVPLEVKFRQQFYTE